RGTHWQQTWDALAQDLRTAAAGAAPEDKPRLAQWAAAAERARREAEAPCPSEPLWSGKPPGCAWLGDGYFATGLIGSGDATALRGKPWGASVFTPAEYAFTPRLWRGALVVLVDAGTGSAAAEFAAVLQDNHAAAIAGAPTPGGCGYTNGGTPTTLTYSGGVLQLPDCARLRADGSNEAAGIDPDVLIGFHASDGVRRKALRLSAALPRALAAAERLRAGLD
ncbi:MAG: hypothetical protein JO184_13760, partial [Gammaproteobacteria bacterium]|nr:hypothetical protein [Gammaproteobacteria bacterium]